jgi:hypothetical protein
MAANTRVMAKMMTQKEVLSYCHDFYAQEKREIAQVRGLKRDIAQRKGLKHDNEWGYFAMQSIRARLSQPWRAFHYFARAKNGLHS